jgi:predicted DNA-binding protein
VSASSKPIPIALPNDLVDRIKKASEAMGKSQQEVMRLALGIGLEDLARIDYNIESAIVNAAKGASSYSSQTAPKSVMAASALLSEEPQSYTAKPKKKAS